MTCKEVSKHLGHFIGPDVVTAIVLNCVAETAFSHQSDLFEDHQRPERFPPLPQHVCGNRNIPA